MKKQFIRAIGMALVAASIIFIGKLGVFFLIPWVAGWLVYDLNIKY